MTFEPKKYKEVFDDMRARSTVVTDFEVGSVARTLTESFAYEIALLYEKMRLVYLSAYVDTAEGQQLDNVVAILGITRGLPDFAEGVVTFLRDIGNEPIDIPLGMLVSTEDTPETPKKVYQTIETKSLPADHTSVEVKVRAVNRGEEEVTGAETITVMPRPLPGIKSVSNPEATRFTGKRRETDTELRERAKNTLISSGKGTVIAIENALLNQPGVKDVRVNERFHFARGEAHLFRADTNTRLIVPKDSRLDAAAGSLVKPFVTTDIVIMEIGASHADVTVQSLLEGKAGEVTETVSVTWTVLGEGELAALTATNSEPILLGDFGVVDVIVDGVDLTDPAEAERIRLEIDRVRAAGILVTLKETVRVDVDAVFSIALRPELKLSAEERAEFEDGVRAEIQSYFDELRMGEPVLFGQIIKRVLSMEGVVDLSDFTVSTHKMNEGIEVTLQFTPADKRIGVEDFERFNARYLCVATETKILPVDIQFKAPADSLTPSLQSAVQGALMAYFTSLKVGQPVLKSAVSTAITNAGVTVESSLLLIAEPWCERAMDEAAEDIVATFVEQPQLRTLFAYHNFLDITGALKLTLPATITADEKNAIQTEVRDVVQKYLDDLPPEADVVLADLVGLAAAVDRVLAVDVDWQDFRVAIQQVEQPARLTAEKIAVEAFEKVRLDHFCITGDVETVTIAVDSLELQLFAPQGGPPSGQVDSLKQAVKNAANNYLSGAQPGENLVFEDFRSALENQLPGANYQVTGLAITATSLSDGRIQSADLGTAVDIHIRSVEVATMTPMSETDVDVTVITPT